MKLIIRYIPGNCSHIKSMVGNLETFIYCTSWGTGVTEARLVLPMLTASDVNGQGTDRFCYVTLAAKGGI